MPCRALLLDRDGVVNVDHGYVSAREDFVFLDGVFELARHAVDRGYRVVVITNQSGLARGYFTEEAFHDLTAWMRGAFRARGVDLAGVFHCPYHRDGTVERFARDSFWRKPNPGMILEAARRFDLDLVDSAFVGDQLTDMEAGRAAGVGIRALLPEEGATPDTSAATLLLRRHADLIPHLT